ASRSWDCGRLVDTVVNETQTAGDHSVIWEPSDMFGQDITSGIYFCDFHAGDEFSQTGKFLIFR
ncbi:MAG: hypothetical protein KAW14_10990, partial [Candidatus Aegiribacteria sp.]|nr:hypothetical protein [Candidatus Aegiribacteria sp.]